MAARTKSTSTRTPTVKDIEEARRAFLVGEPRYLFYRVAIELIDLSRQNKTTVSVAEALAVLLQTWNMSFYRFRGRFTEQDLTEIKALVRDHHATIEEYRQRSITSLASGEEDALRMLFSRFEDVLGPVGAAKSLHLLAPLFFPLWDRSIAKAYHVNLSRGAPEGYISFMRISKEQCRVLTEQGASWPDLLKALDEYNYCTYVLNLKN
jgi:hypothetical protein